MIRSSHILPALLLAAAMAAVPLLALSPAFAADEAGADQVAETYAALLERDYVYPETGQRYADAIRAAIAAGRYRGLSGEALGSAIDSDVNAVSPDGHLRLRPPEPPVSISAAFASTSLTIWPIMSASATWWSVTPDR